MNVTLRDEDALAIDLLLDGTTATGTRFAAAPGQERVQGAERVLGVLGNLPATDPPADLVARTLRFIDQPRDLRPDARAQFPALVQSQPHA